MSRLFVWLDRLVATLGALLLLALLVPVSIQVFARLVPGVETPMWTEEGARFLLVWLVMVGSLCALRRGSHFKVDLLPGAGPRTTRVLDFTARLVVIAVGAYFAWYGVDFVRFGWEQTSEVADWPLWIVFLAWPVIGALWTLTAIEAMLRRGPRDDERIDA
jgi:TRAP-type C4-dicarboxylate transport system permease small subunit